MQDQKVGFIFSIWNSMSYFVPVQTFPLYMFPFIILQQFTNFYDTWFVHQEARRRPMCLVISFLPLWIPMWRFYECLRWVRTTLEQRSLRS